MLRATEHQIQAAIVDALRLAGFTVRESTAYRQKGPSGVDKGIPDLLVAHPLVKGIYLGLEVKRPGASFAYSSKEQQFAHLAGEFHVVQDALQALDYARDFLDSFAVCNGAQDAALDRVEKITGGLKR